MRRICCWNDLRPEGIFALTGESCGLMYRILFDVTERGRELIGRCLGCPAIQLAEPWNAGPRTITTLEPDGADGVHVGSIMLSPEMLAPIAVFALIRRGCKEVWLTNQGTVGIEAADSEEEVLRGREVYKPNRVLRAAGTACDRNVHVFSGRVT